ncbi:hypothetical protein CVT24_000886 [Panaeolus cyanescens]|uniref:PIN domain-containing protein n=1 Tax=Panaeolus cyanescens TaxID=181874 RepID=A0A409YTB6_9AGAR|nr:hypothetical protein CVT24_000886 [Panaeolus cyanescens]
MAMSRALGAAFLNHQVEQLEKTVSSNGPASGNWRERKSNYNHQGHGHSAPTKRGPNSPGGPVVHRKKASGESRDRMTQPGLDKPNRDRQVEDVTAIQAPRRNSEEEDRKGKDADVVVVDASVLLHALYKVKRWCKDGRQEVLIVPLEALNTLDLLKKGTSTPAQKARAASRFLEAQVGVNPRIRVQRDDAFVLWDKIQLSEDAESKSNNIHTACPEWVRRIICCARWETEHPEEELNLPARQTANGNQAKNSPSKFNVVLAVVPKPPTSPQSVALKLADMSIANESTTPLNPVPLPAPNISHSSKHEHRSSGTLVASWAARAGVNILEVEPALPNRGEDEDRPKRAQPRRPSGSGRAALVERPPAVMAMMEMISQPSTVVRVLARGEKLDAGP